MAAVLSACSDGAPTVGELYRAPAIPNSIDGVIFEAGNWEPHLAAGTEGSSWGNHRAVVELSETEIERVSSVPGAQFRAATVTIPWRRHDLDPASKAVIVVDAASGEPVEHVLTPRVENESGDVIFEWTPGSTAYHVYYMPWESSGGYYPSVTYPGPVPTTGGWARAVHAAQSGELARARVTHIQSVDDFHSFFPMEVIATAAETGPLLEAAENGWTLVPEHRDRPIRMRRHLPRHWIDRSPGAPFESSVLRDESFAFQVAVVAGNAPLENIAVEFSGFPDTWLQDLTCFNCEGVDETGAAFTKRVRVEAGTVQPLWVGWRVPVNQDPGQYDGTVTVASSNRGSKTVEVSLTVVDATAPSAGFDAPEMQTRLAWLNSTVGTDPDFIIAPFEPVRIEGRTLRVLGREVVLGDTGLPLDVLSYFTPELTGFADQPEPVLAEPLQLQVMIEGGADRFESEDFRVAQESRGRAEWTTNSQSERFRMQVEGALEYDGMLDYRITLTATARVDVDDVTLPVAFVPDAARYMLGLGYRGTRRPEAVDWTWDVENHQEGVWLGAVHKGLQYVLRDENYVRPLNTNFYQNQPLNLPPSWYNDGSGGIRIEEEAGAVVATNYSGPRSLEAGESLHFNVRFLITPFKPIDTNTHFNTRFVHQYVPVDSVRAWGGTVVNIHHANEINPYINYPFFNLEQQTAYIEEAHEKGIKVKLYNTIRELTYRAHELFAMRSMGDEILNDGEGGGHSWMQEHLEDDYHSAWHAWRVDDAAILNKGTSRWTNYYIEGLNWLAANQEIDGLYLDDIAFSRATVKRLVSVLHEHRDEVVIDLHSANQFNPRDGHINSAMLYMEHFPYISRLWFGEYFEYDRDADYWLTEVSGLPFGLMGEMLQDGGRPYRGMLYGMTARKYGDVDPRPVWAMMTEFGIAESRMLGYWLEDAPVSVNHPDVRATTYVHPDGRLLIALASWSDRDEVVEVSVDPSLLSGIPDPVARTPDVEALQQGGEVDLGRLTVPAGLGVWVVVSSSGG